MGLTIRTVLVPLAALLLPAAALAGTLEMRVFHVDTGLDLGNGAGPPASDYYLDGGTKDGLVPGMRLSVFRDRGVRDALGDREHRVRLPVGELELLRVFEGTSVARVSGIEPILQTPLFEPRAVMIGDYVLPAPRRSGKSRDEGSPDHDNAVEVDKLSGGGVAVGELPGGANDDIRATPAAPEPFDADPGSTGSSLDSVGALPDAFRPRFPSAADWYALPPPVLFELNSSDLGLDAQYGLEGVALVLAENPERLISLEGRTCNLGSASYNHALSLRRARTVAAFLQSRGVAADRVSVFGFGEDSPARPNTSETGRRHNRRVDLRVGSMGPTLEPEIPSIIP